MLKRTRTISSFAVRPFNNLVEIEVERHVVAVQSFAVTVGSYLTKKVGGFHRLPISLSHLYKDKTQTFWRLAQVLQPATILVCWSCVLKPVVWILAENAPHGKTQNSQGDRNERSTNYTHQSSVLFDFGCQSAEDVFRCRSSRTTSEGKASTPVMSGNDRLRRSLTSDWPTPPSSGTGAAPTGEFRVDDRYSNGVTASISAPGMTLVAPADVEWIWSTYSEHTKTHRDQEIPWPKFLGGIESHLADSAEYCRNVKTSERNTNTKWRFVNFLDMEGWPK